MYWICEKKYIKSNIFLRKINVEVFAFVTELIGYMSNVVENLSSDQSFY